MITQSKLTGYPSGTSWFWSCVRKTGAAVSPKNTQQNIEEHHCGTGAQTISCTKYYRSQVPQHWTTHYPTEFSIFPNLTHPLNPWKDHVGSKPNTKMCRTGGNPGPGLGTCAVDNSDKIADNSKILVAKQKAFNHAQTEQVQI